MNKRFSFYVVCFLIAIATTAFSDQEHHSYVSEKVWRLVTPYLMPETHPLKPKLDKMFSKQRVLQNRYTLLQAGFLNNVPEPHTKVIVTRHRKMKGYIFKIYTDDKLSYYRDEPEYVTWTLRARGARLIRREVIKQGWKAFFKAPKKWIYPLPPEPRAFNNSLQKNFILVEEEMDLLPDPLIRKKWRDGTITTDLLDKLFYLITTTGLRGGCKYDNIPLCEDGRMAFIDTQNNLDWPLPYERLYQVLEGELKDHWKKLMKTAKNIPKVKFKD